MTAATAKLIDEVLQLPREARAFLAEKLLETLDYDESFPVSPDWMSEIKRRCREIDEGKARLVSAEEVFAELEIKH